MNIFYVNQVYKVGDIALLSENELHHAFHVMRMKVGDDIHLFNGQGFLYKGVVQTLSKKVGEVVIQNSEFSEKPSSSIQIAVASPKSSERLDFMLEKLIEIGATQIILLETERSERSRVNEDRLKKLIVNTMKQCKRKWMPTVSLAKYNDYIKSVDAQQRYILSLNQPDSIDVYKNGLNQQSFAALIGPEGDFTLNEVNTALSHGFQHIYLGENVLRTETAAIYICAIMKSILS